MTGYLVKVIICSGILMLVYSLLLQNEKMHQLNRIYLLFSLVFSLLIPFVTINTAVSLPFSANHFPILSTVPSDTPVTIIQDPGLTVHHHARWGSWIVLIGYLLITAALLFRLIRNLAAISNAIKHSAVVHVKGVKIVLNRDDILPYSFFNYLFLPAIRYHNGQIEKEIICHEMAHIRQKHSIDILFIELLQAVMWFNPVLMLYRKAIRSNHEFLADDNVVKTFKDVRHYQDLLLEKVLSARIPVIASKFNFKITKKRIIMMTKTTSRNIAFFKKAALLPVFGVAVFFFSTRGTAQDDSPLKLMKDTAITPVASRPGTLQEQYDRILEKHKMLNKRGDSVYSNFSEEEIVQLNMIYNKMSKEQQRKQTVFFSPGPTQPIAKKSPTIHQLKLWTHPDLYGVWIDGKRVSNTSLSQYQPDDFGTFVASSLTPRAQKNNGFKVQIDLMTNDYYAAYTRQFYKNLKERKRDVLVIKISPKQ